MEYLAFDFGDGTVCAARYRTEWADGQVVQEPEILHIKIGKQELWSTLARKLDSQEYIVGINRPRRGFELELNWKSKPSQRDDGWEKRRTLTVLFMERVFKLFLNANPDYDTDSNGKWLGTYCGSPCKIAIGVPCDWSDASSVKHGEPNDIDEYRKMAKEAGLGDVHVFKEAQAAVLYARRFMGDGLPDEYIEKGTLLIDIGSSTTDFTYLKGEKASNMGLTLGAKYVEQSLLGDAMKRTGYEYYKGNADPETKKSAISTRNWNLLEVRGYKEDFFAVVDEARIANQVAEIETDPLDGTELQIGNEEGYITETYVDSCLDDKVSGVRISLPHLSEKWASSGLDKANTWRGHFRTALTHLCKKVWHIDPKEVTVVVTGGASRMQFVKDDVMQVFGKDVQYRAGDAGQQSFSVVKGLAWASYATDAISEVRKTVSAKVRDFIKTEDAQNKIRTLVRSIGDVVTDEVAEGLSCTMTEHPTSVNTKRKIAQYATKKAHEILAKVRSEDGVLINKIKEVTAELLSNEAMKSLFPELQNKLGRSAIYAHLSVPSVSEIAPDIKDVNIDLDEVVNGIGIVIIYIACLCIPGIGWFVALIMALGAAAVIAKLLEKGPDDVISTDDIRKAASKIPAQKDKIREKVYQSLDNSEEGGYLLAISNSVSSIICDVKMQELDALEGLANYRD